MAAPSSPAVAAPRPSAAAVAGRPARSTSRRSVGRSARRSRRRRRAACRAADPAPKDGRRPVAARDQQQRRAGALGVPDEGTRPCRSARARAARELGGTQGGQVGGQRADAGAGMPAGPTSAAPWTSAGLRPASGSSPVTSAPAAASALRRLRVVGHDQDGVDQRAGQRGATVSSAKASASSRLRSPSTAREAGLGLVEPLDRHDQAPAWSASTDRSCQPRSTRAPVGPDASPHGRGRGPSEGGRAADASGSGTGWQSSSCGRCSWSLTKRDWHGARAPARRTGGVVVVTNHVSHVDPLTFAHFLYDNGRLPRFLAKEVLFRVFFVGQVLRGARQIPVYRETADASRAFSAAVDRGPRGRVRRDLPGGTLTRDPDAVADGRQDRRRPGRPGDRRAGRSRSRSGGRRSCWRRTPRGRTSSRARRCTCAPARRSTSRDVRRPPDRRTAAARGDRAHHGRDHRRCSRRSAASRPRPSGTTRAAPSCRATGDPGRPRSGLDEQERTGMTRVAVLGTGSWGTAFSHGAGRRRVRRRAVGPAAGGRARRSTAAHENPDYLPGIALPESIAATADAGGGARAAPRSSCSPCRRRRCAATSSDWAPPAARRLRPGQPDEGHRARHHPADERGHRRGRPAPRPERVAVVSGPEPGQGDRPAPARRQRRRLRRRGGRREAAAGLP